MVFHLKMIAPAADIAALVNTLYIIETKAERIEEVMPAYSAQVIVQVRGQLCITYPDGRAAQAGATTVVAPQLRSAACVLEGPMTLIGASLTPLGWQALSNLPADEVHDQVVPAAAVLTADQIAAIESAARACGAGELAIEALCAQLGAVMAGAPFAVRADHVAVVAAIGRWLGSAFDPPLGDLHDAVAVSPRQLQRISRRFFGVAPAQLLKRYRAIRAAMLLARPHLAERERDNMLASYFDRAHLIRDIRRYTGRTPKQLRAESLTQGLLDPAGHGDAAALLRTV